MIRPEKDIFNLRRWNKQRPAQLCFFYDNIMSDTMLQNFRLVSTHHFGNLWSLLLQGTPSLSDFGMKHQKPEARYAGWHGWLIKASIGFTFQHTKSGRRRATWVPSTPDQTNKSTPSRSENKIVLNVYGADISFHLLSLNKLQDSNWIVINDF